MAEDHRPGTVYWIDHTALGTNDLPRWIDFSVNVLGAKPSPIGGLTSRGRRRGDIPRVFSYMPYSIVDAFLQEEDFPSRPAPGTELPRFGFFVRPDDIHEHLRRLDENKVPHTDPIRTSDEGQDGTAIRFTDPDGNQMEFWAPRFLPAGAMAGAGPLGVGRISHAVFEARDLDRTAEFFGEFGALDQIHSADVPSDTLALALAGGGRLVFKHVDALGAWTLGRARWHSVHTALTVREEDYFPNYQRMWAALPEGDAPESDDASLPARTIRHPSSAGRRWFELYGRGDEFRDWDLNAFHFITGIGVTDTPELTYKSQSMEYYVEHVPKDASGRPLV